jgi:hypothetical protein
MMVMNNPYPKQNSFGGHINEQCNINFMPQGNGGDFGKYARIEVPESNK